MTQVKALGVRCKGCDTRRINSSMVGWEWHEEKPYCPECLTKEKNPVTTITMPDGSIAYEMIITGNDGLDWIGQAAAAQDGSNPPVKLDLSMDGGKAQIVNWGGVTWNTEDVKKFPYLVVRQLTLTGSWMTCGPGGGITYVPATKEKDDGTKGS